MSAESHGPDDTVPADDQTWDTPNPTDGSNDQYDSPVRRPGPDSDLQYSPLSYRIERARLRARIAALEQALETSENRRQAVIDRYERLLSDREGAASDERSEPTSRSDSLLARIVGR